MASAANLIFSILTVIAQIFILAVLAGIILKKNFLPEFFAKNALAFAFAVALVATLGSLFYSEIAGYEPCKLCWFQRIFMYPQVLILGLALIRRDKNIGAYSILLSVVGAVIAGYHYLLQIGAAPATSCGVVGYSAQCSEYFAMNFGYITLPMMSFTAFLTIIVLMKNRG